MYCTWCLWRQQVERLLEREVLTRHVSCVFLSSQSVLPRQRQQGSCLLSRESLHSSSPYSGEHGHSLLAGRWVTLVSQPA